MNDYAAERNQRLEKAEFTPIIGWKERSIVSVAENDKSYKVQVTGGLKSAVFQVDGEIIKDTGSKSVSE